MYYVFSALYGGFFNLLNLILCSKICQNYFPIILTIHKKKLAKETTLLWHEAKSNFDCENAITYK